MFYHKDSKEPKAETGTKWGCCSDKPDSVAFRSLDYFVEEFKTLGWKPTKCNGKSLIRSSYVSLDVINVVRNPESEWASL